jgi:hypothetical protein
LSELKPDDETRRSLPEDEARVLKFMNKMKSTDFFKFRDCFEVYRKEWADTMDAKEMPPLVW